MINYNKGEIRVMWSGIILPHLKNTMCFLWHCSILSTYSSKKYSPALTCVYMQPLVCPECCRLKGEAAPEQTWIFTRQVQHIFPHQLKLCSNSCYNTAPAAHGNTFPFPHSCHCTSKFALQKMCITEFILFFSDKPSVSVIIRRKQKEMCLQIHKSQLSFIWL